MTASKLTTEEITGIKDPVLIVDKDGVIGKHLILKLGKETQVVIVSASKPELGADFARSVLHIPFIKKFPAIPDGKYSSIFIIDNKFSDLKNLLPSFYEKASKDNLPIVYAFPLGIYEEQFVKEAESKYLKLKFLVFGDVFDETQSFDQDGLVNKFLYQAAAFGKVEVPGDGIVATYPVYLEDLVISLLEIIYGNHSGNLFYAFPKHAPTALAIARAINKADPDIRVDFVSSSEKPITAPKIIGVFLLGENYAVDERIRKIIKANPTEPFMVKDRENKPMAKIPKKREFPLGSLLASFVFFLLLPLLTTFTFSIIGAVNLWQTKLALENGNMPLASFFGNSAKESFSASRATFELLNLEAATIGLSGKSLILGENIDAGKDVSNALVSGISSFQKFEKVFSGETGSSSKDFSDANLELSDALVLIKKTEANRDVFSAVRAQISKNDELFKFASSLSSVLPELIGVEGKRNYLVLFQNNMELRPTGGFIGSYGVLSLDKGKVNKFSISDVYDADGQLKGHVEPPFAIRRYLPSAHWYLRDSNFDLEYSKSASAAAFFIKVEKNQDVDGVISIDVSLAKKLLQVLGPVHVSEYNQDVSADNFFKLAEEHSEKNFFPGSTQKKDFLGAAFRAIEARIFEKKASYLSLFKVVENGLLEKNILLASSNPYVQGLFSINGWSSTLLDQRANDGKNIADFLEINEANLGVNKVNYFIDRKASKNTVISDDGRISSELKVSYRNNSDGSWPGGDYKNYLRIALPLGTQIASISIDGQVQDIKEAVTDPQVYEDKAFTPPAGLEVENYQEDGKEIYGFLVNVAAKTSKEVVIDYTLASQLDIASPLSVYDFKLVKQPGMDNLPFDFTISFPNSIKRVSANGLSGQNSSLVFNKSIVSDTEVSATFSSR